MKRLLSLILFVTFYFCLNAGGANWKLHPIFDEEITHIVDTRDYVYFTSRNMALNDWNEVYLSLFRFDKKGEEIMSLSPSNFLNGNSIRDVVYNPEKGYLAILYKDYNIDLLFNEGKIVNIPYYANSEFGYDKKVNSITFDPANDRIYLATDFGYVSINDKKFEVAESRIYDTPIQSFCRLGNSYLAMSGNELMVSPDDSPVFSIEDFKTIEIFDAPALFYPLDKNLCIIAVGDEKNKKIKKISNMSGVLQVEDIFEDIIYNIDYTPSGLNIATGDTLYQFFTDGTFSYVSRPESYRNIAASSNNMTEVWNGTKRRGINSIKKTGENWKLTRDFMLPNSPSPYASVSYANHPEKGLLVLNYGYNPQTTGLCESIPFELSSYKKGRWTNHAPAYTNPARREIMMMTNGMVIDPDDNAYVYVTSYHNGIVRLNLNDPYDILHLSRENDPDASNSGFMTLVPTSKRLPICANFSAPYLDSKGNLWMNYADWDDEADPNPHLYCWTAEDRRSSLSSAQVQLPKLVEVEVEVPVSNKAFVLPLLKTGNGCLVHVASRYDESVVLIDTNGTPLDQSDDKIYKFPEFRDSDGNNVEVRNIHYLWEDPSTGYVWVCHLNGVCYFIPSQVLSGNFEVNRIKVSRNDGTNLADYLLDGVTVNQMLSDPDGRKWFATAGGGIVCTTADGSEIIEEFNSSNSYLPDDMVYGLGYNSSDNSLMISTAQGFAEYFLPGNKNSSRQEIKISPNPVRPDYYGYVTISDLPQNSLVKITDVSGNLVKDLGVTSGFEILWDISDMNHNRVKSGVYHIMVSPSYENGSFTAIGKVLVIS